MTNDAMITSSIIDQATRLLAEELVELHSPEELELFPELIAEPDFAKGKERHRDDPLAFGINDTITSFSPIAIKIAASVVEFLAKKAGEVGGAILMEYLKKKWSRDDTTTTDTNNAKLLSKLRTQIMDLVVAEAVRQGLNSTDAVNLGTAVQRRLKILI